MTVNSFKDLENHIGHETEIVKYGEVNVAIECVECGVVLVEYDKPTEEGN